VILRPPRIRTLLLGLTLLLALQAALAIYSYWRVMHDEETGFELPLSGRVAAMVESLEAVPPSIQPTLLEAMASKNVFLWIASSDELNVSAQARAQLPQVESDICTRSLQVPDRRSRSVMRGD